MVDIVVEGSVISGAYLVQFTRFSNSMIDSQCQDVQKKAFHQQGPKIHIEFVNFGENKNMDKMLDFHCDL